MAPNPTIKFPQFAPDITSLGTGVSGLIQNALPRVDGYGPMLTIQQLTKTLPATCRGYMFARKSDGSIAVFAGTATDLYLLNNTDFSWIRVSKGGVSYATLVSQSNWQFAQFNDTVIAVQVNTPPQAIALTSPTAFADLGGTPPNAGCVAVVNFFLVLTELLSNPRRVQWCDLGAITTWTAGVGLADFQDLPDGGSTHGLSGGDSYGLVFQDSCVRSFTYAPGSSVVFQITRIAQDETLFAKYSIINSGTRTFYNSAAGFKVVDPGGSPKPIGKGRVDDFFKNDVDISNLQLVIGANDPTQTRVFFGYKSKSGAAGLMDKMLCYDWSIGENGEWSLIVGLALEYIATLAKPGITLENLDAIAPTPLNVLGAASSPGGGAFGAGKVRLTLDAVSNAFFQIAGQNFIEVQGILGTTEANGSWLAAQISIPDATHLDINVPFVNAWISGGQIGGSVDALTFSLDSISQSAIASLSGMTLNHAAGFFNGPAMEAILETDEQDQGGINVFVSCITPLTDCPTALCSIGGRKTAQQTVPTYSAEKAVDINGRCNVMKETRYPRGRLRLPAGSAWTYARGLQPEAQPAGDT